MNADVLVHEMAGCGRFQVFQVSGIEVTLIFAAWQLYFMAFGSYNPGWKCGDRATSRKETTAAMYNTTFSRDESLYPNYTQGFNYTLGSFCNVVEKCIHIEYMSEESTIVTEFDLICDDTWLTSLMISIQMVGGTIGAFMAGQLSGRLGRKFSLYSSVILGIAFNVIAVFSVSWEMFLVVRFFLGVSFGGIIVANAPFYMEFINAWWRSIVPAIPFWNFGAVSFSACAWILKDWKHIHIATAAIGVITLLPGIWVYESLRWLAVRGKIEQAKQVVTKMCQINGRPDPDTGFIDDMARYEIDRNKNRDEYSYLDLFRTIYLIKATILFPLLWLITAMSFYCILFSMKSLFGNFYLNFFLGTFIIIPPKVAQPWLALRFGRKLPVVCSLLIASFLCFTLVLVYFVMSGTAQGVVMTTCALACGPFVDVCWTLGTVFACESFPTVLRSHGYGATVVGTRIGSILAPYIISRDFDTLYRSFIVMGSMLLICSGLMTLLPDTKDVPMKDSIEKSTKPEDDINDEVVSTSLTKSETVI